MSYDEDLKIEALFNIRRSIEECYESLIVLEKVYPNRSKKRKVVQDSLQHLSKISENLDGLKETFHE